MTVDPLLHQGDRAELHLTGSFLWGRALTPAEDGYEAVQAELLSPLRRDGGQGWDAGVRGLDDPTLVRYAVDGSGNLTRTRIDRAAARRQHRLDSLAFLFAGLTLATSIIAAAEFTFGGPSERPVRARILVLVASSLLLVLLLYARLSRHVRRGVEPVERKGAQG